MQARVSKNPEAARRRAMCLADVHLVCSTLTTWLIVFWEFLAVQAHRFHGRGDLWGAEDAFGVGLKAQSAIHPTGKGGGGMLTKFPCQGMNVDCSFRQIFGSNFDSESESLRRSSSTDPSKSAVLRV